MKQTINFSDFEDAFRAYRRNDQFSSQGLRVVFDYLEECEESTGEELELDVIAICCDFYEGSFLDIANDYDIDIEDMEEDDIEDAVREYLESEGVLVGEVSGGFVYRAH